MDPVNTIRLFALNNLTIESDIRKLEEHLDIDLGHRHRQQNPEREAFYPQFPQKLRENAERMAEYYAIFFCLENSIRQTIRDRLEELHGNDWWTKSVPKQVAENAERNRRKELAAGVTLRSDDYIDYTNFGELGEIIKANWDVFGDMFLDVRAVERILGNLNTLRAPIAHCNPLADDEIVRLELSLRDWFRQMG